METIIKSLMPDRQNLPMTEVQANMQPVLSLAYLGDSLFDLYIRSVLLEELHCDAGELHKHAVTYVCAHAQALAVETLSDSMDEQEKNVARRGRNTKVQSVPKNASLSEYHLATAFETLLGYLYVTGKDGRLEEIMRLAYKIVKESKENG